MAEVPPSDGDLPVDPLFGDWLNGSPAKGGAASEGPNVGDSRFMDAVLGAGADSPDGPPAPESTPFSEAVFGGAAQSGEPDDVAGTPPAEVDTPFGAAVIGNGTVGHRRLTRPVAMAGIMTLVGVGWLGVWSGISPGARHDLGDVVRALPGGNKLAPASQHENTAQNSTPIAGSTPAATVPGAASPSVAGLNIGSILQPALFQAGAVSSTGQRSVSRHAPSPDTVSSPGKGGVTIPSSGVPDPTPPVVSTGTPGPTRPGGWGGHPTPTGDPSTPTTDPTTPVTDPTTPVTDPTTPVTDPTTPVTDPTTPVTDPTTPVTDPTTPVTDPTTPVTDPSSASDTPSASTS